jgi:uncharacterized membrane protein
LNLGYSPRLSNDDKARPSLLAGTVRAGGVVTSAGDVRLGRAPIALGVIALAVLVVLIGAPLFGWIRVLRLPAILVPALLLALAVVPRCYWRDSPLLRPEWQPSRRLMWSAAAVIGGLLFWYLLTRFRSGEINAIDFTIYYDRPCYQTVHGRPLFVETSDTPGLSHRSELADHAYWGMLVACAPYAVYPSPLWLHALSVIAIIAGGLHVLRIAQRLGAGGALACATALAFVLNDNTARTLNYGFHPEVLYAWFIPWMIDAGLRGASAPFLAATLASALVKEDACLPIFAATVALALNRFRTMTWSHRAFFLVLPNAIAIASLAVYYAYVLPMLSAGSQPAYAHFWANYGPTPMAALVGMLTHPGRVLKSALTSGVFRTIQPHLFLPLLGWRWALGTLPIVALYGASANEQVRAFAIYYAIVVMPFFVLGASTGALALARRFVTSAGHAQLAAAVAVLLGPLLVGSGHRGYSLRPWKSETAAVKDALAQLGAEPRVLVQSGLFPHAGYDERFQLLTPETLADPQNAGAVLLLARRIGAYPFFGKEMDRISGFPSAGVLTGGLLAVRITPDATAKVRKLQSKRERLRGRSSRLELDWGRPRVRSRRWRSRENGGGPPSVAPPPASIP